MPPLTRRLTAPTLRPLTPEQVRAHLRVSEGEETEDYLNDLLDAVVSAFEVESKTVLMRADYLSVFPAFGPGGTLTGLAAPVAAVTELAYADDGTATPIDALQYQLSEWEPGTLRLRSGYGDWLPQQLLRPGPVDAIAVRYTAGYASPADVPPLVLQWLRLTLGHWYENRQTVAVGLNVTEVPETARKLMNLLREPTL